MRIAVLTVPPMHCQVRTKSKIAKQLPQRRTHIRLAHQMFTDKNTVHTRRAQTLDVRVCPDA